MKRIKEIQVKNFKAFQDEQPFKINGKNVLVYGNNGSGKSSLFWALYTLLQSSTKDDAGVQKYFKKYLDSDISTHQTLKNVFVDENEDFCSKMVDEIKNEFDEKNGFINDDKLYQLSCWCKEMNDFKKACSDLRNLHQDIKLWPYIKANNTMF